MDDITPPHPSGFMEHARESSALGLAGLVTMLLCVAFVAVWPYLVARRCKPLLIPLLVSVGLGLGGYAAYDWPHVSLNLAMRDPQIVREDCETLLRNRRKAEFMPRSWNTHLAGSQMPASIARLGATEIVVSSEDVHIFMSGSSSFGGRGYLYDPKRASTESNRGLDINPTWYPDFYEFLERYE